MVGYTSQNISYISYAVCILSSRYSLSKQAVIFSTPASIIIPSTSNSKQIYEPFFLNLGKMAGTCFFLLISVKACQMRNSYNQNSYESLFCNDDGALNIDRVWTNVNISSCEKNGPKSH